MMTLPDDLGIWVVVHAGLEFLPTCVFLFHLLLNFSYFLSADYMIPTFLHTGDAS